MVGIRSIRDSALFGGMKLLYLYSKVPRDFYCVRQPFPVGHLHHYGVGADECHQYGDF